LDTLNEATVLSKNLEYSTTILPDGKWLFLESNTNQVVVVSPTAGVFWEHCTGESSLSEIISDIARLYPDTGQHEIEQDVYKIVPMLIKHNLIQKVEPSTTTKEDNHGDFSKASSTNAA